MYAEKHFRVIKAKISRIGADALYLADERSLRYLIGFYFSGMVLLVPRKGKPICLIDTMNHALAEDLMREIKSDILLVPGTVRNGLKKYVKESGIKIIAYSDEYVSVSAYNSLKRIIPGIKFVSSQGGVPVPGILADMRKIKSEQEIDIIRKAAKITTGIWRKVRREIRTGMTEKQIAVVVDVLIRQAGCVNSFPTITAIAENTAYPHAIPTSRRLKENEHVLVDFGVRYKGYCSDLTRVYLNGRIDRQIRGLIDHVHKAHDEAIGMVKNGTCIGMLGSMVNKRFLDADLGGNILHGLGHGIGIEVHERPFLRVGSREKLKKGMVITIEPGLYVEGLGGIREEDMILVTDKGCEVLTV